MAAWQGELSSKGFDLIDWYELDPEVVKVCQNICRKICDVKANNKVKHTGERFESIKSKRFKNMIKFLLILTMMISV